MKPHNWEIVHMDIRPVAVEEEWVCTVCGIWGGDSRRQEAPTPREPDCDEVLRQKREDRIKKSVKDLMQASLTDLNTAFIDEGVGTGLNFPGEVFIPCLITVMDRQHNWKGITPEGTLIQITNLEDLDCTGKA